MMSFLVMLGYCRFFYMSADGNELLVSAREKFDQGGVVRGRVCRVRFSLKRRLLIMNVAAKKILR